MHLVIIACVLIPAFFKTKPEDWNKYHLTILYLIVCSITYEWLCKNYPLWQVTRDGVFSSAGATAFYIFIVYPSTLILFLKKLEHKDSIQKKLLHVIFWICLYVIFEMLSKEFNLIKYSHGWNLWWSIAFDCIMFTMFILHTKMPSLTYALSFIVATTLMLIFKVPF